MGSRYQGSFLFEKALSSAADGAFGFHQALLPGQYLMPCDSEEIRAMCENGELFLARRSSTSEIVALCYVTDKGDLNWELGGLTTADAVAGLGIGSLLCRVALAHHFAHEGGKRWDPERPVIAHVHADNDKPIRVLKSVGFALAGSISVPPGAIPNRPAWWRVDSQGNTPASIYEYTPEGLKRLAAYFSEFDGTLGRSPNKAIIQLEPLLTVRSAAETLTGLAAQLG